MKRLMWPEKRGCSVAATKDGEWYYVSPKAAQLIGLPKLPPGGPVEIEMAADGWKVVEQLVEKDWLKEAAAELRNRADAECEAQSTDSSYYRMIVAVEEAIADRGERDRLKAELAESLNELQSTAGLRIENRTMAARIAELRQQLTEARMAAGRFKVEADENTKRLAAHDAADAARPKVTADTLEALDIAWNYVRNSDDADRPRIEAELMVARRFIESFGVDQTGGGAKPECYGCGQPESACTCGKVREL